MGIACAISSCAVHSCFWCGMVLLLSRSFGWNSAADFYRDGNACTADVSVLDTNRSADTGKYSNTMAHRVKNAGQAGSGVRFTDFVALAAEDFFDRLFLQFLTFSR